MSFQWIIDTAESISMNRMKMTAQTTARDGMTRTTTRGSQLWKFVVKLPDGLRWSEIRPLISASEKLDKTTTTTIQFNNTGHDWMVQYQGNCSNPMTINATWTKNSNTINISGGGTISSGYYFRAGDIVQLGTTGKVYTIAEDVAYTSNVATLHRPVLEDTGSGLLKVGQNCVFSIKCTDFPTWTIFARDQVSWSGAFTFIEVE